MVQYINFNIFCRCVTDHMVAYLLLYRYNREKIVTAILGNAPTTSDSDPGNKPESAEDALQRTLADLREVCECPVCLAPFSSSMIFACENDHWLCGDCKVGNADKASNRCPMCDVSFEDRPPRRCITGEKLARLVSQLPSENNNNRREAGSSGGQTSS